MNMNECEECGQAVEPERVKGPVEKRLEDEARALEEQEKRTRRAAEIIAKHPEFEELIELFGIIKVPVQQFPYGSIPNFRGI